MTHKNQQMREMFANKEFRQALSLGINRKEIIDIVYLGQSAALADGSRPGHPWEHKQLSTQFTDHDPKKANEMLDKLGYNARISKGFASARRAEGLLRHRRDPDALSGRGRHAGAGEERHWATSASTSR